MMLQFLGEERAADALERSVVTAISKMKSMNAGQTGFSTSEIGDMVAAGLQ